MTISVRRFAAVAVLAAGLLTSATPVHSHAQAPSVQRSVTSPFPAVAEALRHVTTFNAVATMSQHGQRVARAAITAVRQGAVFAYHAVVVQAATSGRISYVDIVLRGSRTCIRTTPAGLYRCGNDAATAARERGDLDTISGVWAFAHPPVTKTFTPAPVRMIGSRACVGYTFHPSGATVSDTDVLYLAKADHLPCELIQTGTGGGADTTWSRYNDPGLTIPRVG